MAQLVERYVRNVQATSSNLVISTTIRHRFGGAFFVAEITSCSESCIPYRAQPAETFFSPRISIAFMLFSFAVSSNIVADRF